jgi:Zn finger protein HypA/HybF involved in hydrogenase expression
MEVVPFNRTLEQELLALARGVSMECLVCGEFVLRRGGELACPECRSVLRADGGLGAAQLEFDVQAG